MSQKKAFDGKVPPAQGLYETSTTEGAELGTRLEFDDGRVFRYVKSDGTGTGVGFLVAYGGTTLDVEASNYVISVANYNGTDKLNPWIVLGTGTVTANAYDDGFITINSSTGAGQTRKVKENTTTIIKLYDPLVTAVSATSHATLIPAPYTGVKKSVASGTNFNKILGVAIVALGANEYGWIQTRGWAGVTDSVVLAIGLAAIQGTTAGNTLQAPTNTAAQPLGTALYTGVTNGDLSMVYLTCE